MGNRKGETLFITHSHPAPELEAAFLVKQAEHTGIRLIGMDRLVWSLGSINGSAPFLDWSEDDVVELAEKLHIERFAVVGFSGRRRPLRVGVCL